MAKIKEDGNEQMDTEDCDYETCYNLGIAYKEMGLIDEAIEEFQLAAKDEGRRLECASMLGICFLEKGMARLAVKWFEKGLHASGHDEEQYQALRYQLAAALEAAGDTDKAQDVYRDLYGEDDDLGALEWPRPPAGPVPIQARCGTAVSLSSEPHGPLSEKDKAFIGEHLAQGWVFKKYGLVDKAVEQFEAIIARFPDHGEAWHELVLTMAVPTR